MPILRSGYIALVFLLSACAVRHTTLTRFEFRQRHMGIEARIVLYAPEEEIASRAARAAFARVAVLDSLMSDYRVDSELNRLSARAGGPPVPISGELFFVLSRAQELARLTNGAFDVTVGPLVRLWREARRTGVLPPAEARREALERSGWRYLRLDTATLSAQLLRPRMQLDLGGIAKGYAADEAIATLRAHGVTRALVEMGGDIVAGEPPPGAAGWKVEILNADGAERSVVLARAAVSTSGDTEQFVDIGGRRYSHVVDPTSGLGLASRAAATVVAADGITADAVSTVLTVLGRDRREALLSAHFPDVRGYVRAVEAEGGAPPR
ncbi:MAG: FAD:protein FMN transferase [Gemmatimonadetes bacterium]|nr:FAD:protein FMN transferase [Gemmatimonadota bacterium]